MRLAEKLMLIQSTLKAPKGQFNSFGKYKYRSAEDILEAVKPVLKEVGASLVLSDEIIAVADRVYVKATATLYDIASDETIVNSALAREADEKKGMDASQITGTASSYARKYAMNGLFCIDDTKDADTDEYTARTAQETVVKNAKISDVKVKALEIKLQTAQVPVEYICKTYKVKTLADMTEVKHDNLISHWTDMIAAYKGSVK